MLRLLAEETGESAIVMRRVALSAVCLHQVEAREALRVSIEPGTMAPLYAGAPSRVLLAFAPPEILEEVVLGGLQPLTPETPNEAMLRDGLAQIVRTGFATSEGEFIGGSVAIAVPIIREDGIVAALAVTRPIVALRPRLAGEDSPAPWVGRGDDHRRAHGRHRPLTSGDFK